MLLDVVDENSSEDKLDENSTLLADERVDSDDPETLDSDCDDALDSLLADDSLGDDVDSLLADDALDSLD